MTTKCLGWRMGFGRNLLPAVAAGILLAGPIAANAQSSAAAPIVSTERNAFTFEVVSIHQDKSTHNPQSPIQNGPTADGYRLKGLPLIAVIQVAYIPSQGAFHFGPNEITGVPAWLYSIEYDIDARISDADLPNWKDPTLQPAMFRAMLQAMLADRFKLVVHRETKIAPIYELTLGRNVPKFKPSQETVLADIRQKHPDAITLSGGAIVAMGPNPGQQRLFGVTMPGLSTFLSNMAGRPIHDKTGLTGKYDITYQLELPPPAQGTPGMAVPPDFFTSQIFYIVQDQLGLRLKAARGLVESLRIDHVERSSEN